MEGDSDLNNSSFAAGEDQSYGEEESQRQQYQHERDEESGDDALEMSGGNQNDSYLSENYLTEQQHQRFTNLEELEENQEEQEQE